MYGVVHFSGRVAKIRHIISGLLETRVQAKDEEMKEEGAEVKEEAKPLFVAVSRPTLNCQNPPVPFAGPVRVLIQARCYKATHYKGEFWQFMTRLGELSGQCLEVLDGPRSPAIKSILELPLAYG